MAQYIKQGNIFGRIGSGLGKGLAEQLPKEVERGRLQSGLRNLGEQKGQTPFQQFAGLASLPGATPQMIQSGTDLLRQQAILDNVNRGNQPTPTPQQKPPYEDPRLKPPSATTTGSTAANLEPYIPPSGPEREQMARNLMANEPQVYRSLDEARAAIANQVSGNIDQSNALIGKGELEEKVQNRSEQKLKDEIATVGAQIPGKLLSKLQQQAIDDVTSLKLSPDQAKIEYGKRADEMSNDFSNIKSWGDLGLITKSPKDLIRSMSALQTNAKKYGYQKEAADSMIADNGVTPQFAYATMYPVSDIKPLNDTLKSLKDVKPIVDLGIEKFGDYVTGGKLNPKYRTLEQIMPKLAKDMGKEGSPLAISYELEKKGYDSSPWKQYLADNQDDLNLTSNQINELQKPQPSFFGWLNDLWLKSFTGVK